MRPLIDVIEDIVNDPFLTWDEKGRAVYEVLNFNTPMRLVRTRRGEA